MFGEHPDLHVLAHSFPSRRSSDLTGQCARAIWCQGLAAYGDARSVARKLDSGSAGIDGGPRFRASTIIGLQASERLSRNALCGLIAGIGQLLFLIEEFGVALACLGDRRVALPPPETVVPFPHP